MVFNHLNQFSKSYAGTLSIEFSSEKEKIITNCGSLKKNTGNAAYLRYSAAHSTVVLENTNISKQRKSTLYQISTNGILKKHQDEMQCITEASHNGYLKNYKKIVKRKLIFKEDDNSIYGED